jgi:ssDNA-binding Zn-finger/Zn-ribbon topoisomerase 1
MFNKNKKEDKKENKKEAIVCPKCNSLVVMGESAYDRLEELDKVKVIAQQAAIEFLQNIYEGYDQDHAPLYGTSAEKLQSSDVREQIPVISDMNIFQLQELLTKFYQRHITLEIKSN